MPSKLQQHWQIARDYFLRPGFAALLPWRFGFKLLKHWSKKPSFRDAQHQQAFQNAQQYFPELEEQSFIEARRLTTLVDDTDLYLSFTRGDGWLKKHVHIDGPELPTNTPCTILDYHWGAGTWFIRHMRAIGLAHSGMAFRLNTKQLDSISPLLGWYAKLRYYDMRRHPCSHLILQPNDNLLGEVRKALQDNNALFYLFDVRPISKERNFSVNFLGQKAQFPRGMLSLTLKRKLPVYAVWTDFDRNTGKRQITIHGPYLANSQQHAAQLLAEILERSIRKDPAHWHMWPATQHFILNEEEPDVQPGR